LAGGGELLLSCTATSDGKLPRFSVGGGEDVTETAFIALSEWCRTFCECIFLTGDSMVRTHISAAPSSSPSSSSLSLSSSSVLSANVEVPESTSTGSFWSTIMPVMTAVGLTAHPLSNLLINAEADKSSSGSAVTGGNSVRGGGGGRRLVSTSGTTVIGGDGGGGGGVADHKIGL